MQNMMPNLQSNIYNYNSIVAQAEPIAVENLTSFNVPPPTVTVLNSNVNNDFPQSAPQKNLLPITGAVSKESSYLDFNSKQNDRNDEWESKGNSFNQRTDEISTDWCQMEKIRIAKLCKAAHWTEDDVCSTLDADIQPPRKIGAKCSSEFCKRSSSRHCYEFSEKLREVIFNFFWQQLNLMERKVYVCDLIELNQAKRSCTSASQSVSLLNYFLRINSIPRSVCKKMFINTIGIGEHTIRLWMSQLQRNDSTSIDVIVVNSTKENTKNKVSVAKSPECMFKSKQQESPDYWIRDKVKKARERGEAYFGYCIKTFDAKSGRRSYGRTLREQRTLGPPCTSSFCKRSTKRQCARFTEMIRGRIFDRFWKTLGWDERKAFVIESVDIMQPKRRTCLDVKSSRRGVTCSYFLCVDGKRHNICRQLFLNTLGIKEATVQYWLMQNTTEQNYADQSGAMRVFKSKRIQLPDQQK